MSQRMLLLIVFISWAMQSHAHASHGTDQQSVPTISLSELPTTTFSAVQPRPGRRESLFGDFTFAGPVGPLTPLPFRITKAVVNGTAFGISHHDAFEFTLGSSTASMLQPSDVPELSWTTGITFDSLRERILISTLGGEGFLYALDPNTRDWSVVNSLNQIDLTAIAFSASRDRVFGVESRSHFSLHEYSAAGELLESQHLAVPVLTHFTDRATQLIEVDGLLALLQYPQGTLDPVIHAIHPETGEAWLVVPEPASWLLVSPVVTTLLFKRVRRSKGDRHQV